MRVLLILALLSGCATTKLPKVIEHDKTFNVYIERFKSDYKRITGKNIVVNFPISFFPVSRVYGHTAICVFSKVSDVRFILIDTELWRNYNKVTREAVVYHELGHCTKLGRMHNNDRYGNGRPKSLMNANVPKSRVYKRYRKEYLEELFLGNKDRDITETIKVGM